MFFVENRSLKGIRVGNIDFILFYKMEMEMLIHIDIIEDEKHTKQVHKINIKFSFNLFCIKYIRNNFFCIYFKF